VTQTYPDLPNRPLEAVGPSGECRTTRTRLGVLGTLIVRGVPAAHPETVRWAKARWRVEQNYAQLKDELGLDHFEGRCWLGWHHHVTMAMMAYGFLIREQLRHGAGGKKTARVPTAPQVRAELQYLLKTWTGRCIVCGQPVLTAIKNDSDPIIGGRVTLTRVIRRPGRGQRLAFLHDIHGEHPCGTVACLYLMHNAWADVPRLTGADWLVGLTALHHRKLTFQQIGSIKPRMSVETGIHLWRNFDMHYHRFEVAVWDIESFENRSGDWLRHTTPPTPSVSADRNGE